MMRCWLLLVLAVTVSNAQVGKKCLGPGPAASAYPPTLHNMTVPVYEINLDAPPEQRWTKVIADFKQPMIAMINSFTGGGEGKILSVIKKLIQANLDKYAARIPSGYMDEVKAMASQSGVDPSIMFLYQIMYEIEGLGCTSTIIRGADGTVYHGRNLDFGLGSSRVNHSSWELTEMLRPLIFEGKFMRGGKVLFTTTSYAGYIGVHTGARPGRFSVSINSRFDKNVDKYLLKWLTGHYNASFISFKMRQVLEKHDNYDDLTTDLQATEMVGPSYVISGSPTAGAISTYSPGQPGPVDRLTLESAIKNGSYFILQTNYDHWNKPPFFDNRRDPAEDCLRRMISPKTIDNQQLFWLMSSEPTLNQLTTFTTLVNHKQGTFETYKQNCWDKKTCVIW